MPHRHWTAEEKIRIVLESLNTSIGVAELCRKYTVNPVVFYAWKEKFIEGGKQALTQSTPRGFWGFDCNHLVASMGLADNIFFSMDIFCRINITLEHRRDV